MTSGVPAVEGGGLVSVPMLSGRRSTTPPLDANRCRSPSPDLLREIGSCPAQNLMFELPFLLRVAQPGVLCPQAPTRPPQSHCRRPMRPLSPGPRPPRRRCGCRRPRDTTRWRPGGTPPCTETDVPCEHPSWFFYEPLSGCPLPGGSLSRTRPQRAHRRRTRCRGCMVRNRHSHREREERAQRIPRPTDSSPDVSTRFG